MTATGANLVQTIRFAVIPQVIPSFQGSVLTDLSPQQFAQLACLVPKLRSENLIG